VRSHVSLPHAFPHAQLVSPFVANRAILDERPATAEGAAPGSYELQVEWADVSGSGRIWLPRALLMADGVTEGMVHEFEDNLVSHTSRLL
jgi:hypothetical protein